MEPITLLVIAGAAFVVLSAKKTAVANTANLTAQQRQSIASANSQNQLFSSLGALLKGFTQPNGQQQKSSGSGGGGSGSGGGGSKSGGPPASHPGGCAQSSPCPALAGQCPSIGACDHPVPSCAGVQFGPPAPCDTGDAGPLGLGPCVTVGSCAGPSDIACSGIPACVGGGCAGSGGCCV